MRLSDIIAEAINEENAKNGQKTNWVALHTEKEIIDEKNRTHEINGQYKERR